ncbi:TAXI family TRAP transporter solute-binding subunit [Pseudooceanicola nanhaiensis]|uniref:TAXI family TRAP transporter solute-binding subunit n=1 Tax=Pseudooceanicola nanhaiensis TaxID=375761 RepID=UPI001CD55430|nr:TAXI family TRAP transporter solute-binding subunit [Pseudooceanicola nanhaiensis]MCA0921451.1 TAXI family TRAP transporter solute-binding subunit [Pseudooceanicola nanhaiensis]
MLNSWKFAACLALGLTSLTQPAHAELRNISIGTNPSGSVYNLIGSGLAKTFQEELGIRSTAQPYAGESVYLPAISIGDINMGLITTILAGLAWEGKAGYPQPLTNQRALANVWHIPHAFIARADSGIETMEDLRGKRVMGELPTARALTAISEAMLASGGLSTGDVDFLSSGGLMDGIAAVVEGRADAAPVAPSMPVLLEANTSVPGGLRIVANGSLGSHEFFEEQLKGLTEGIAMANDKQPFVMGDTPIVSYDTILMASDALSDDDAYTLTKTMYENWSNLQQDIGPMRSVPLDRLVLPDSPVPYHPGAVRFYKEVGLWTDAAEANQAKF